MEPLLLSTLANTLVNWEQPPQKKHIWFTSSQYLCLGQLLLGSPRCQLAQSQAGEIWKGNFHAYFYTETGEKKITDLIGMRQKNNETGLQFLRRFKETRSLCYSLVLTDSQLAGLAAQGSSFAIREKFGGQEFENWGLLTQRVVSIENQMQASQRFNKNAIATADTFDLYTDDEDEVEADVAKWTWGRKPVSCLWLKVAPSGEEYDFDANKADKIFDFLLERG